MLTWEVTGRYFFKIPSDWQDELSIFLLVGATFLSAAWIQARRGHVGIDALAHILPPAADRVRRVLADIVSLAFCIFFGWNCWELLIEAVEDGQTSDSAWGPPLWIPYGCMAVGMSVLVAQLMLQLLRAALACTSADEPTRQIGLLYGGATLVALFSGMPIAFALGTVATLFMLIFMPAASLDTVAQNVYEEMASITLLTIPLFILKGAAIGKSRAGNDLYAALHAWLHRIPGGLGVAVVIACGLFAAMAGSSAGDLLGDRQLRHSRRCAGAATRRGFAAGLVAAGGTLGILLPPSITLILYAVAAEQSLGPPVPRRHRPGHPAGRRCSRSTPCCATAPSIRPRHAHRRRRRRPRAHPRRRTFTRCASGSARAAARAALPDPADRRHGRALRRHRHAIGDRRPRRRAGAGADRRRLRRVAARATSSRSSRARSARAACCMMIIGMSLLYSYVMSYLHISQGAAEWIVALHLSNWLLFTAIVLLVVVLGILPAAGQHHPDDGADHPAAAAGRRLRPRSGSAS